MMMMIANEMAFPSVPVTGARWVQAAWARRGTGEQDPGRARACWSPCPRRPAWSPASPSWCACSPVTCITYYNNKATVQWLRKHRWGSCLCLLLIHSGRKSTFIDHFCRQGGKGVKFPKNKKVSCKVCTWLGIAKIFGRIHKYYSEWLVGTGYNTA